MSGRKRAFLDKICASTIHLTMLLPISRRTLNFRICEIDSASFTHLIRSMS